ncbi:protein Shroom1 isoform X3 [Chelonia mydas]|uniref:protein Shroom1 isoform X3 n=1 Tax=Chelonia mydas TaxID=8469 RepID=UPI001CAA05E9|nr:protein Shroom1 isoform X3 [Chelonia mydas]XP_043408483.1 protein Shroom1 isoform X3 [Chelonia mydas]
MASYGNEIERWNLKQAGQIAELLEPVASPDYGNRLSPLKSISSLDHLLDSAYSSFSGGSNVPEYHSPSYYNENYCLPLEQLPYMDSEYVRGIYNPNAINSDPKPTHQHKSLELGSHHNSDDTGLNGQYRSTPTHGTLCQPPSPLALPPRPPSPPARLHSYKATRNFEITRGKSNSGNHFDYSVQLATCAQDISNVLLPSDSGTNWVFRSKNEGLMTEESKERDPSQDGTKQNKPHIFIRPSSIIFQEYLKSDSLAKTPNLFCTQNSVQAYKIPEEVNCKSSHPLHTNLSAVNDTQENKQYLFACGVHKPLFREADLQSRVSESSQQEGQFPCIQCPCWTEEYSSLDQDVLESRAGLKYMDSPLLSEDVSEKLNSSEDKNQCSGSKEENRNDVWELLLNQHIKMQKSPLSHSLDGVETEPTHHGELDFGNKQFSDSADQTSYYRPNNDSPSQFSNGLHSETQSNNSSPDLNMNPKEEDTLNPVHQRKHQREFQKKLERQPQDDSASEKINRQTTPLLYYLSGGKNTNILSHKNHTQQHEDSGSLPKTSPRSNHPVSAQPIEIEREINQLQKNKHHLQCTGDDTINETDDVILGSSASSVDESFKNDYREKLKVAQRKVLRETSFKRKDLQMSLPIRLKQKPSKRPSIEHLRSLSLSSANEDAKLIPLPKSLENSSKEEETKRPQAARIGGRKRITEEQKKLCYSEPEKLNKLDDRQDQSDLERSESTGVRSDEINEQDAMAARRKILENRGSALASSNLSKTELKQIQHTALIEYMERKIAQRPASALHKPPLQKRPSNAKRLPEGKTSKPDITRKTQNNEVICQFLSPERIPEPSPALIATGIWTNRHSASSSATETAHSKPTSAVRETDGNCTSKCASAENLIPSVASASSKGRERSKSSSSPAQDLHRCTTFPASSIQGCENYPSIPRHQIPEKEESSLGGRHEENKDSSTVVNSCCPDVKELTPEIPILFPRRGDNEETQVEKECSVKSLVGKASKGTPRQQLESNNIALSQEKINCHTASLAQSEQGDQISSSALNEKAAYNGQNCVLPEKETDFPKRRLKSPEDQRYEELAMEIIATDNSLADILIPRPTRKTALDLLEGLFPVNISISDRSHRNKGARMREEVQPVLENESGKSIDGPTEPCSETDHSAGPSTEDPNSNMNQILVENRDGSNDLDDITSKKKELISSIQSKLQTLWEERELVLSETKEYALRGKELEGMVQDVCKPNEYERYQMFIGDLEKVVSLLLCLSSRLARVQNAMRKINENTDAEEKQSLHERHNLLTRQREDAKDLKENLDRRERVVSGILSKYLTDQQLQDYKHFVQVKTSLLIEQKDLEEQIKFLEEQLESLEKSILL